MSNAGAGFARSISYDEEARARHVIFQKNLCNHWQRVILSRVVLSIGAFSLAAELSSWTLSNGLNSSLILVIGMLPINVALVLYALSHTRNKFVLRYFYE